MYTTPRRLACRRAAPWLSLCLAFGLTLAANAAGETTTPAGAAVPAGTEAPAAAGGRLYALATQPLYLAATGDDQAGTLMPSTELVVLGREGARVQATLSGWQQQGAGSVLYAAAGKRIVSASLSEPASAKLRVIQQWTDASTGQLWQQVSLPVWLPAAGLTDDPARLWASASATLAASCAGCHALPAAQRYSANQWLGVIKGMAPRTALDQEQIRLLTQYVQKHASDMPAGAQP